MSTPSAMNARLAGRASFSNGMRTSQSRSSVMSSVSLLPVFSSQFTQSYAPATFRATFVTFSPCGKTYSLTSSPSFSCTLVSADARSAGSPPYTNEKRGEFFKKSIETSVKGVYV